MYLEVLALPIIALLIAQTIKLITKSNGQGFNIGNVFSYSGMPSGHSAMIVSLATIVALVEGVDSTLFAISFILAIIIIRDALGIRRYLGQHGHILNALVKDLKEDSLLDANYPHLLEKIGHTPAQVLAGSAIGLLVSLIGYLIF